MNISVSRQSDEQIACIVPTEARYWVLLTALAGLLLLTAVPARANSVTFQCASGDLLAEATFQQSSNNLVITLANTSAEDVLAPEQILTAVFFDLVGEPILTPQSAVLASGSVVLFDGQPAGGVVGGEWAFWKRVNEPPPPEPNYGISSSGLGLFGPGLRFPGDNLSGPDCPDGLQYGLTSLDDDLTVGNQAVTGQFPLVRHAVTFTLSGLPDGFNPATSVSNLYFHYGTEEFVPIPEPLTLAGVMTGLVGLAGYIRKRRMA